MDIWFATLWYDRDGRVYQHFSYTPMLHKIAYALVMVGAINWGLVGVLDFDLVAAILGDMTTLSRIVYTLVGASAIYMLATRR